MIRLTCDDGSHAFGGSWTQNTDDEFVQELLQRTTDETSSSEDSVTEHVVHPLQIYTQHSALQISQTKIKCN